MVAVFPVRPEASVVFKIDLVHLRRVPVHEKAFARTPRAAACAQVSFAHALATRLAFADMNVLAIRTAMLVTWCLRLCDLCGEVNCQPHARQVVEGFLVERGVCRHRLRHLRNHAPHFS